MKIVKMHRDYPPNKGRPISLNLKDEQERPVSRAKSPAKSRKLLTAISQHSIGKKRKSTAKGGRKVIPVEDYSLFQSKLAQRMVDSAIITNESDSNHTPKCEPD